MTSYSFYQSYWSWVANSFLASTHLVPKPLFRLHAFYSSVSYVQICAKRLERKGSTQPLTHYRCKASNKTRRTASSEVGTTAPEHSVENKGERAELPLAPIIPCIISFSVTPSSLISSFVIVKIYIYSFIWDHWWRRRTKPSRRQQLVGRRSSWANSVGARRRISFCLASCSLMWLIATTSTCLTCRLFSDWDSEYKLSFDILRITVEEPRKENHWTVEQRELVPTIGSRGTVGAIAPESPKRVRGCEYQWICPFLLFCATSLIHYKNW